MKKIFTIIAVLVCAGAMAQSADKLEGTWNGTVDEDFTLVDYQFTFNQDGTYNMTKDFGQDGVDETYNGTYVLEDHAITMTTGGLDSYMKVVSGSGTEVVFDMGGGPITFVKQ